MKEMNRIAISAMAALMGAAMLQAQEIKPMEASGDTTVVAPVSIRECDCKPRQGAVDNKASVHLDFDLPFYRKVNNTKTRGRDLVGRLGIGSVYTDAKAPFDFSPQNSLEFYGYMLMSRYNGSSTLSYGPGLTFRNFALTGSSTMIKSDTGEISTGTFPAGSSPKVSKLRLVSVNMPLLYSYHFGKGFGFTLGPVVNFNVNSSIVNKYSLDGGQKDKYKNVHCNLVTVDAMFQLNLKYFSLYAKYCPMDTMNKNYWPQWQTWVFGVAF